MSKWLEIPMRYQTGTVHMLQIYEGVEPAGAEDWRGYTVLCGRTITVMWTRDDAARISCKTCLYLWNDQV